MRREGVHTGHAQVVRALVVAHGLLPERPGDERPALRPAQEPCVRKRPLGRHDVAAGHASLDRAVERNDARPRLRRVRLAALGRGVHVTLERAMLDQPVVAVGYRRHVEQLFRHLFGIDEPLAVELVVVVRRSVEEPALVRSGLHAALTG